ncbi:MAG: sigma-E factor regulatory protein RseB domain-containing protein [Armatimonadota bacterium]|nr:sigma-E factor regulatory protein RseB domain-containing protein [Armatimonadota bacterium]MDR7421255.1 sigma-E factor regulatory protein RseB domain-containing protein [Armatimonadota bacterium]MDR7455468.1 sigma-E factor regulatory protein RseB domain-containing protein [Armatimonadota bacterium]MDR7455822.1 sigma-E factor regulatory protein RseB domain-containing protein [Armatimonadota bacterium]MDR7511130.1 sigma-E factor regulatory protein RseB domain-containing protein [Armatimonadota
MALGLARAALVGALAILLGAPSGAAHAAQPMPAPLLHAVQARAASAYRGEQIVVSWEGGGTQVTLGRVEHDPPAWTRLEYTPVGSSRSWVIVRQGTVEVQYDPSTGAGTRAPYLAGDDDEVFSTTHLPWLLENYRISTVSDRFLGRSVDRVLIRPVVRDRPARRIDIDRESGVILRSERIDPAGRLVQLAVFLSFEVMPRGWRAGADLPRGLRLAERPVRRTITREDATARLGAVPVQVDVPVGFHRVADYLAFNSRDGRATLQTIYSDGLTVLMLTAQRGTLPRPPQGSRMLQVAGGPVWIRRQGASALVHWAYRGWVLTMVGEVSLESLVQVAARTGVAGTPRVRDHVQSWLRGLFGFF